MNTVIGIVLLSSSFLSSSVNSLCCLRSTFRTLWTNINFFTGLYRSIASIKDVIQYQIL